MTAISVLNQQIGTMEKKVLDRKKVFFYLLPFVAAAAAYSLGFESVALPLFVVFFFVCIAFELAISGKDSEDTNGEKAFVKSLADQKAFEMGEAKKLLKKYNAVIYRVDTRNHTIQFFLKDVKYTMYIKPKV